MKIDGLTFTEAIERLADKVGIQLRREEGDDRDDRPKGPPRQRLVEANRAAQEFYAEQLAGPDARGRPAVPRASGASTRPPPTTSAWGSRRATARRCCATCAGAATARTRRSPPVWSRSAGRPTTGFRGRLLWPIRDPSGATIGFGARRIFDDDRIEAKYLNTPETTLYKKSQVLYGIDLARKDIAKSSQAVVVEGYTDVMACHLAGVTTAVASCGTAFGEDHTRVLRRFLNDHEEFRGEVIFTFDGDAAGQNAALKTFQGDQSFVAQTYVAIEPDGLDPCDVRIQKGDAAVRDLVARRVPLYRFVLGNVVSQFDLDRADGRVAAVREAAKLVTSSRDASVVNSSYARDIAALTGMDPVDVQSEVRRAASRPQGAGGHGAGGRGPPTSGPPHPGSPAAPAARPARPPLLHRARDAQARDPGPDGDRTHHRRHRPQRLHPPDLPRRVGAGRGGRWRAGRRRRRRLGRQAAGGHRRRRDLLGHQRAGRRAADEGAGRAYVSSYVFKLLELTTQRRIADLKSRLQRTNPVDHPADYNRMFGELAALEQHRRTLRDRIAGPLYRRPVTDVRNHL